jgi:tRNA A-37 threonylcarbamoyl transferase component Bud32
MDPTVIEAMHVEEAARARGFGRALMILCFARLALDPLITSKALWLRVIVCFALAALGLVSAWVWWRASDPARYTRRLFRVFGATSALVAIVFLYHGGVFSPMPLIVTLGIAFFGLGADTVFAFGITIACSVSYAALASLVGFGALTDMGLIRGDSAPIATKAFLIVLVPAIFLVTLWQARLSRRATLEAIQRSNEAIRLARKREAQIDEANQNLDMALRAVAGGDGRYTGQRAGKYLIAEVIGRGAMGEVYEASHEETGEKAAVKVVRASVLEDPSLMKRFLREGQVAGRLNAPNVVRVHEVGEIAEGVPYIAMELLRGHDLAWHLRQRPQMDSASVIDLVDQVAAGLQAAHNEAIVHRDLKPQNIFLTEEIGGEAARWKILDFGISKLGASSGTLTQNMILGTPGYMAPEQAQGLETDHRSDVFALGAVAYRALTGRPAFSGVDMLQILFEVVYHNPLSPMELCPSLPEDVELVLAVALAKKASERFSSATELASALREASRGELDPKLRARGRAILERTPWARSAADATLETTVRGGRAWV